MINIPDLYYNTDNFKKYDNVESRLIYGQRNMANPYFTVFIPTYRRSKTLKQTIDSVMGQIDFDDYEIIIINNDPDTSDDVIDILKNYNDYRLAYYVNDKNIGLCGNWNRGIELAKGKYVIMIHDDDVLSPWHLATVYSFLRDRKYRGIVGCLAINFVGNGLPEFLKPEKFSVAQLSRLEYFFGSFPQIAGITIDKKTALELGGYCETYYPNEDSFFFYQVLLKYKVTILKTSLAGYRMSQNVSLSEGVMENICLYTDAMRKNISKHEIIPSIYMKLFGKEYLYHYIKGAERFWNISLNVEQLLQQAGYKVKKGKSKISKLKLKISTLVQSTLIKFIKLINKIRYGAGNRHLRKVK